MNAIAIERSELHEEAFADLFQSFHPRVLGICRRFLGSYEAEDASIEIFLRLPKAVRTYDSAMPFSHWLSSVAGHYCVDLLRKRRSEQRIFQPANPEGPEAAAPLASPLQELLRTEEQKAVREALARLPERYRLPLVMQYYEDLSHRAIARKLGLSCANVKTLIFRAKQELRSILSHKGFGRGAPFSGNGWLAYDPR